MKRVWALKSLHERVECPKGHEATILYDLAATPIAIYCKECGWRQTGKRRTKSYLVAWRHVKL